VEAAVVHLARWAAERQAEDAADSRAREQRLRQLAEAEATLAVVLAGLAERRATAVVLTNTGATHRATVAGVGADYVVLVSAHDITLVSFSAVDSVQPDDAGDAAAFGDRPPTGTSLAAVLSGLANDGVEVRVVSRSATVAGEIAAVGEDVLTLRPAGAARNQVLYVPVASVSEVSLRLSG
jgi:hypothetical protein